VTNENILFRQIHPSWVIDDNVSSQAFKPTPKDDKKLSVYNGNEFSAEESFEHFTKQSLMSAGVLGVTDEEFDKEQLPRIPDDEAFKGHVLVDYSACSKNEVEKKAKRIRDIALKRSWLYINKCNDGNNKDSVTRTDGTHTDNNQ
jgi:hypothetical protein